VSDGIWRVLACPVGMFRDQWRLIVKGEELAK